MAEWEFKRPGSGEPIVVVTGDKVPEPLVRQWFKANMPPPRTSPLQQTPTLSMPTPFEFSDGSVFQSPKGFFGPGVIANAITKMMSDPTWNSKQGPVTPDVAYKEGNKGLIETGQIAGMPLLPSVAVSSLIRRLATQGAVSAGGEALAGGSAGEIAGHGALGALTQGGIEGLLGLGKLPFVNSLAKKILGKHENTLEKIATTNTQNAEGMARNAAGKDLVRQMDKGNIAAEGEQLMGQHAAEVTKVEGANAASTKARDAQVLTNKKADRDALKAWKQQAKGIEAQHREEMLQHAQQGAQQIMDEAKRIVPAWQGLPSDASGLIRAVKEDGQQLLSEAYAPAMEAAVGMARGTPVHIPLADAKKLGITPTPVGKDLIGGSRSRGPKLPSGTISPDTGLAELVPVDAGNLITAVTKMKGTNRDWDLYHRTVDTISDAGLGIDPAARAAYKHGSGVIQSVTATNAIQRDPVTNTIGLDANTFVDGMLKGENINILRRRGMGGIESSPEMQAMMGAPAPPILPDKPFPSLPVPKAQQAAKPTAPDLPEMPQRGSPLNPKPQDIPLQLENPEAPNFNAWKLPGTPYARGNVIGGLGSMLGGILGAVAGGKGAGIAGAGGGALAGGYGGHSVGKGLGMMLPDEIKTTVPVPGFEELLKALLMTTGTAARTAVDTPTGSNVDVSPADLAEIRAAQLLRQTAADDPRLQLNLDPSETR